MMENITPPFQIKFILSRGDYMSMIRMLYPRSIWWYVALPVMQIVMVVVFAFISAETPQRAIEVLHYGVTNIFDLPWKVYAFFFGTIAAAYAIYSWVLWLAYFGYKDLPTKDKEQIILLDDTGIHIQSSGLASDIAWDAIVKVIESKNHILLAISKHQGALLALRDINAEYLDAMKTYIAAKIPAELPWDVRR